MKLGLPLPQMGLTGEDARPIRTALNLLFRWTQWHLVALSNAADINLPNATSVSLTWDTEVSDASQLHAANAAPISVPRSHQSYLAVGAAGVHGTGAAGTGRRLVQWNVSGTGTQWSSSTHSDGVNWRLTVPIVQVVTKDDSLDVIARHDVGAGTDVVLDAQLTLFFVPLN